MEPIGDLISDVLQCNSQRLIRDLFSVESVIIGLLFGDVQPLWLHFGKDAARRGSSQPLHDFQTLSIHPPPVLRCMAAGHMFVVVVMVFPLGQVCLFHHRNIVRNNSNYLAFIESALWDI